MATSNGTSSAGPTLDFAKLSQDMYSQWESSMTAWWDQVLDSPDFLKASGDNLSRMAQARKQYETQVDEGLTRMHLPTRSDLVRVARIATLLEERLLQVEDSLLKMQDQLASVEKETIQARVEAAEARLEQREHLVQLQARLDALEGAGAKPAATRKRSTSTRKRTSAKKPAADTEESK